MASRRYSLTCQPNTDTWLRTAWPGMTDAEITEACRRDGRCGSPIAVGDVHIVGGPAFVYQCISFMDNLFTVTHRQAGQTTTESSQRDYTNYSGGNEANLPCTSTHVTVPCGVAQAYASSWRIYVRP